jgi:hypothetical protein
VRMVLIPSCMSSREKRDDNESILSGMGVIMPVEAKRIIGKGGVVERE